MSVAFTLASVSASSQEMNLTVPTVDNLFQSYSRDTEQYFPFVASENGVEKYAGVFANDLSEEWRTGLKGICSNYLSKLTEIRKEELSTQAQLSYEIFQHRLLTCIKNFENTWHLMPINQTGGWVLNFPVIGAGNGNQPFKTAKNYKDFLLRIDGFIIWVDTAIANMRTGMAQGITPPRDLMLKVIPQLEAQIVDAPRKSMFYQPLDKFPAEVDEQMWEMLKQQYLEAIDEKIIPAYHRLLTFIKDEYLSRCRTTHGLGALPGGHEMYRQAVRNFTTSEMTPEQIFELGVLEVERITKEIAQLRLEIRSAQEPEPKKYSDANALLDGYRELKEITEKDLGTIFGRFPKTSFDIKAIEPFREKSMSSSYIFPSMDGKRPGVFYLNTASIKTDGYGVVSRSLYLHEAVPGHHFQVALQRENKELPFFRRNAWYSAFGEGWALYAEGLGTNLGLYTNRHDKLQMLTQELLRAARLVVDVGLHQYGWSREKGIQYLRGTAEQSAESAEREVERYMAWPGQALSYKVGQLKLLEIRKKAESKLGSAFDIRAFHDEILKDGSMPLDILETKMDKWIVSQQR
jgi:uncharacterized protein (DUF885 family)